MKAARRVIALALVPLLGIGSAATSQGTAPPAQSDPMLDALLSILGGD